jgi:hypothetical protein
MKVSPAPVVSTGLTSKEGHEGEPSAVTASASSAPEVATQIRPPAFASLLAAAPKSDTRSPIRNSDVERLVFVDEEVVRRGKQIANHFSGQPCG